MLPKHQNSRYNFLLIVALFSHVHSLFEALEVIRALREKFPIERAQMLLRVRLPAKEGKAIKAQLLELVARVDNEEFDGDLIDIVRLFLIFQFLHRPL
jgi:hypothetical protein